MKFGLFLSVLILVCSTGVFAQVGTIAGVVRTDNGYPIPDARVLLSDGKFSARTDSLGRFFLPSVPVGRYQLFAMKEWFLPRIVKELRVENGRTAYITVTLTSTDQLDIKEKKYPMPFFVPDSNINYR